MWYTFIASIVTSINSAQCNGTDCYFISNPNSMVVFASEGMYVDKETGLLVRTTPSNLENGDTGELTTWPAADYVYTFDTVTENDFIKPDLSEYEISQ